jgi:Peptidase A4 family
LAVLAPLDSVVDSAAGTNTHFAATEGTTVAPPPSIIESASRRAGPRAASSPEANWSGYFVTGGPFTSVSGTFKVPFLYNDGSCGDGLSNWVGIDGIDDTDLVQAGVQETYSNPSTGQCDPSASFWVEAWWEVLPATETIVHSVRVHPGDRVTVFISKTRTPELWYVSFQDDTDGQGFDRLASYSGPGRSAEWVDESLSAPSGTQCGGGVAPDGNATVVCPIAPYTGDRWSDLELPRSTKVPTVLQKSIVQDSTGASSPSAVIDLSDLLARGFTDSYSRDTGS